MSAFIRFFFALAFCLWGCLSHAQTSLFDLSFGSGGKTIVPLGTTENGSFEAVELQADGKILVVGNMVGSGVVARFKANGLVDSSFGTNGFYSYGDFAILNDIKLQPDGKIVVTGADYNIDVVLAVRLNTNGLLDPTFGAGGIDSIDFGLGNASGYSLALQTDGKIVLAGQVISNKIGLARLQANGDLDSSFGTYGKVISTFDWAYHLDLAPDGKIVIGGHATAAMGYALTAMRFLTDGTLDTSFNHTGTVYTAAGTGGNFGRAVKVQPDGKILLCGSGGYGATGSDFVAVRYNTDGSLDGSWGSGGIYNGDFFSEEDDAWDLTYAPDGKVLLAGIATKDNNIDFGVQRLNSNGTLDITFGVGGKISTPIRDREDYARSLALQSDGKVVVVGNTSKSSGSYPDPVVARYYSHELSVMSQSQHHEEILLYPNPASNLLHFEFPMNASVNIKIMDMTGRVIDAQSLKRVSKATFDLKQYAPGLYLYEVTTNSQREVGKVVISGK